LKAYCRLFGSAGNIKWFGYIALFFHNLTKKLLAVPFNVDSTTFSLFLYIFFFLHAHIQEFFAPTTTMIQLLFCSIVFIFLVFGITQEYKIDFQSNMPTLSFFLILELSLKNDMLIVDAYSI